MPFGIDDALLISAGTGLLSGLTGMGDSPKDEAMQQALQMIQQNMPYLSKAAYTKDEINTLVKVISQIYRGGANVAAGQTGSALAEQFGAAGVPQGQPQASMYVSELAPVIAKGEEMAGQTQQWGTELFANIDAQTKQRVLQAIQTMAGIGGQQAEMNPLQKFMSGFLGGANLGATGVGNFASAWAAINKKYPNVGGGGASAAIPSTP